MPNEESPWYDCNSHRCVIVGDVFHPRRARAASLSEAREGPIISAAVRITVQLHILFISLSHGESMSHCFSVPCSELLLPFLTGAVHSWTLGAVQLIKWVCTFVSRCWFLFKGYFKTWPTCFNGVPCHWRYPLTEVFQLKSIHLFLRI